MFAKVLICILVPLVTSISFTPVPIYYITESDITSEAKQQYIFNLALCGGEQFDHYQANVFVNFPDKKWNPVISDYVYIQVADIHGHIIASNEGGTQGFQVQFKFLYHKQYSDLHLIVTSGNAPDLKYTITVTFTDSPSDRPSRLSSPPNVQKRFMRSEEEILAWKKIQEAKGAETTQDMVTIFKTTANKVVQTADVVGFELGYCFNTTKFPGDVVISVLGTDEFSGFATYACTHETNCTSTEKAPYYDTSGAVVNFVSVHLKDPSQDGAIQVLVRGDGRVDGENHFTLSASKFTKRDKCVSKQDFIV